MVCSHTTSFKIWISKFQNFGNFELLSMEAWIYVWKLYEVVALSQYVFFFIHMCFFFMLAHGLALDKWFLGSILEW